MFDFGEMGEGWAMAGCESSGPCTVRSMHHG